MMVNSIEIIMLSVVVIFTSNCIVIATKETPIPVNDIGEGSQCDQDQKVANVCLACSTLSFDLNIPLVDCCSNEYALEVCKACSDNKESCMKYATGVRAVDGSTEDDSDDVDNDEDVSKRYGRIFMKPSQKFWSRQKRYGRLFMKSPTHYKRWLYGKRDGSETPESGDELQNDMDDMDKRYGRLYIGSGGYFGKRDDGEGTEVDDYTSDLDKRYGRVYLGSGGYFGRFGKRTELPDKRYGRLFMGDGGYFGKRDDGDSNVLDGFSDIPDKRYGRVYLGNGGYFGRFGKRDNDGYDEFWNDYLDTPDKRYGRLFIGSSGRYFGKRDDQYTDMDKRYGRLFVGGGNYFGKRSQDFQDIYERDLDKRFGKLFVGSGGYFGKREDLDSTETEHDFTDNPLGSDEEDDDSNPSADKRFGRLFMGGKFGRFYKNYRSG